MRSPPALMLALLVTACTTTPLTDAEKAAMAERHARECQTGSNLCRGGTGATTMSPEAMRDAMNRRSHARTGPAEGR